MDTRSMREEFRSSKTYSNAAISKEIERKNKSKISPNFDPYYTFF
jgi:hypothetical protein